MNTPYTYCITHVPSGKRYYGVRWAKNCDPSELWVTYFTSSKVIKSLIEQDGAESFTYSVRKVFTTIEKALLWEQTVLYRLHVIQNDNWLNTGYFSKGNVYSTISADRNQKISDALTGRVNGPMLAETKAKIGKANAGRSLPPRTQAHCDKLSSTPRKKMAPRTEEHTQRLIASRTGKKTKPKTEEAKRKISLARKARYGYKSKFD